MPTRGVDVERAEALGALARALRKLIGARTSSLEGRAELRRLKQARKRAARRRRAERKRAYVLAVLDAPCTDCGRRLGVGPHQMEFDHVPGRGEKLFSPTDLRKSLRKIKEEIAKCDVVCCACHERREASRGRSHHSGKPCPNFEGDQATWAPRVDVPRRVAPPRAPRPEGQTPSPRHYVTCPACGKGVLRRPDGLPRKHFVKEPDATGRNRRCRCDGTPRGGSTMAADEEWGVRVKHTRGSFWLAPGGTLSMIADGARRFTREDAEAEAKRLRERPSTEVRGASAARLTRST